MGVRFGHRISRRWWVSFPWWMMPFVLAVYAAFWIAVIAVVVAAAVVAATGVVVFAGGRAAVGAWQRHREPPQTIPPRTP